VKKLLKLFQNSNNYGSLILLTGVLIAVPLIVLPFYPEEARYWYSFAAPSVFSVALGAAICIFKPSTEESISEWQSPLQKGGIPVLIAWCFSFIAGALPFVIAGELSPLLALFESISGWTTTGLTIVDVSATPRIFLFHRAFMQYCGGLGFVIMITMLHQGKQSMNLFNAEGHPDRLVPNIKKTSRVIFLMYSAFLAAGILLYRIFGMNFFDAVCHAMSAISTAGFSTRVSGIGEYGSVAVGVVTIVLMLIGSTNFAVVLLLVQRKFRQIPQISELRFLLILLAVFVPLIAFSLITQMDMRVGEGIFNAVFGTVASLSTTGYTTMDYMRWPPFAMGLLILMMFIGGGSGSTAGGLKLSRVYLLFRVTRENIRKRFSPARRVTTLTYHTPQGKTEIDNDLIKDTFGFITCFVGIFIIGTLLVTLTSDGTLLEAMVEFGSTFCTVGIVNHLTNADSSAALLVVQMMGMVLGRLEIFIVFIGIYSIFRKVAQFFKGLGGV
jgi:trk system potassium uptake protein TrkH